MCQPDHGLASGGARYEGNLNGYGQGDGVPANTVSGKEQKQEEKDQ